MHSDKEGYGVQKLLMYLLRDQGLWPVLNWDPVFLQQVKTLGAHPPAHTSALRALHASEIRSVLWLLLSKRLSLHGSCPAQL